MIVNDSDRALETEFLRSARDGQRILRLAYRASQHRIDSDVELRELRQKAKFLIENLEAFLRDVVRIDVVNADLKVIESGAVQSLYALGGQQVAVGDQRRDDVGASNTLDQGFQFWMKQGLAAAESYGQRS